MNNPKNHTVSSAEIFSYDHSHASYQNDDGHLPPPTNFPTEEVNRPFPPFSNQGTSGQCSRQRPELIRKILDLSPLQLRVVVGKKHCGLKKLKRTTNVEVTPHFAGKKGNKLIIDGNEEDVEAACDMVSSMLTEKMAKAESKMELKSKKNESTPNENLPSDAPGNSPLQENTSECTIRSEESSPRTSSSPQEQGDIFSVPLPSKRVAAINSIKAVLRRIPMWRKKDVELYTLERFIRYFETQTMSEEKRREFLNQVQGLSYVLYTNCSFGKAKEWLRSLKQYKNTLSLKETGQFVAAELHEEISLIYCNIANPSLKDLPNMLNFAESRVKKLQAEIEDEKKRGIKNSAKKRMKIRIRGDRNLIRMWGKYCI